MKAQFIRIAAAKTLDPGMLTSLAKIEALAAHYEEGERSFADRIKESKAKRGEGPTKLRKAQRDRLTELQNDQIESDADVALQLQSLTSPQEVVHALHMGMSMGLKSERALLKHYHPDDLPIGEDMLSRKEALVSAFEAFLAEYPDAA